MIKITCSSLLSVLLLYPCYAGAQQAPSEARPAPPAKPLPATYEGCVSKLPKAERYVLATASQCMLLDGDIKPAVIASHLVKLHGLLLEPNGTDPLTLRVDRIEAIRDACPETCKLLPPGTRGIHGKEKPGSEGGPAGVIKPPPQP